MEKGTVIISLEEYFSLIEFKKAVAEGKCITVYDIDCQRNVAFYNPSDALLEIKQINDKLSEELDFYKRELSEMRPERFLLKSYKKELYENAKEISLLKKENQDLRLIKNKKNWFELLFG